MKNLKVIALLVWAILATAFAIFQAYHSKIKQGELSQLQMLSKQAQQMAEKEREYAEMARNEAMKAQLMAKQEEMEAMKALAECQGKK